MENHYFVVLVCMFLFAGYAHGQFKGDICTLQSTGQTGTCKSLLDCQSALDALQNNQGFPQTCGFEGSAPIVCCANVAVVTPSTTAKPTTATTRKPTSAATRPTTVPPSTTTKRTGSWRVGERSELKCIEYSHYTYEIVTIGFTGDTANVSVCGLKNIPLIIGGEDAWPKEYPHQALLGYGEPGNKIWQCGGSLVNEQYVLTAGHCTNAREGPVRWIRLGDLDIESTTDDADPQEFDVAEIIRHPQYKPPAQYNDIALLKMNRPVKFNKYIRPICLHTKEQIPVSRFIASGWGRVEYAGASSSKLQMVVIDHFTQDLCNQSYKSQISKRRLQYGIVPDTQLCAGGKTEEKDTCQGDSGGPLQIYNADLYCTYNLVGVTSFGKVCGVKGVPGVYTRVSHYIKWIEDTIWPNL